MEAWRQVVWTEVCGAEELLVLACTCKFLAATMQESVSSALDVSLRQMSFCADKGIVRDVLPHSTSISALAPSVRTYIASLIQQLQGDVNVLSVYDAAWEHALQHVGGTVVVNCSARCSVKCLVSATVQPFASSSDFSVVVSENVYTTWLDVVNGGSICTLLPMQLPMLHQGHIWDFNSLVRKWKNWLQNTENLVEFLASESAQDLLEGRLQRFDSTENVIAGLRMMSCHLGMRMGTEALLRHLLHDELPSRFGDLADWMSKWTPEQVTRIEHSWQWDTIAAVLKGRFNSYQLRRSPELVLYLTSQELISTPSPALDALEGFLAEHTNAGIGDLIRAVAQASKVLFEIAQLLSWNLRWELLVPAMAQRGILHGRLSGAAVGKFMNDCYQSGAPFIHLRLWLRYLRPMPWLTATERPQEMTSATSSPVIHLESRAYSGRENQSEAEHMDDVFTSTMIRTLVVFTLPTIMMLFEAAAEWIACVKAVRYDDAVHALEFIVCERWPLPVAYFEASILSDLSTLEEEAPKLVPNDELFPLSDVRKIVTDLIDVFKKERLMQENIDSEALTPLD